MWFHTARIDPMKSFRAEPAFSLGKDVLFLAPFLLFATQILDGAPLVRSYVSADMPRIFIVSRLIAFRCISVLLEISPLTVVIQQTLMRTSQLKHSIKFCLSPRPPLCGNIRNGIMPHLWGINLSHIYAREVR
jgi:hypothetical protein